MNTLTIDTGLQTFSLNGECEVSFNPSDATFFNRLYDAFVELDKQHGTYRQKMEACAENDFKGSYAVIEEADKAMRPIVDGVFFTPVCDALFKGASVTALTKDGLPVWAELLMQIAEVCDKNLDGMDIRASKKIKAYTDKYKKKYHR